MSLQIDVRYDVVGPDGSILGFVLNGVYYEGDQPSGEIKDGNFYYRMANGSTGESHFPGGIGGCLDGMDIVRAGDGSRFRLVEVSAE
jgi:hypothetical protein